LSENPTSQIREFCNHCSNLIEYLLPTLELPAVDRVLHGFIAGEGELRLTVTKVFKGGHIVGAFDGLMLYAIVLGLDLVAFRVGEVHGGDNLLERNDLVVFAGIPEILAIGRSHAAEELTSNSKIDLADGRGKTLWPPPLHHVLRVCPRPPDQLAWGVEYPCDHHPFRTAWLVFRHLSTSVFFI
jgi:hypothetical protein